MAAAGTRGPRGISRFTPRGVEGGGFQLSRRALPRHGVCGADLSSRWRAAHLNFLLWQLAHTDLFHRHAVACFDAAALDTAFAWYAARERRFGRTSEQIWAGVSAQHAGG
jgi:hypothetical protein